MESYPLQWPDRQPRTPYAKRKKSMFKVDYQSARAHLKRQIIMMNGMNIKITSTQEQAPVAVYFNSSGTTFCFACDMYKNKKDNLRAIGLTIENLRGIKRWGSSDMMEQAFKGFEALPAPSTAGWREILGLSAFDSVGPDDVKRSYKTKAKKTHPDHGGDAAHWYVLQQAYEQARIELGF